MVAYSCISGQSWSDVVLDTYGSMDLYAKALNDNNVTPESTPFTGFQFMWDNTLTQTDGTEVLITKNTRPKFATLTGYGVPDQPNPNSMTYKEPISANYTATSDGETAITIVELQGNEVVTVTMEIKQLKTDEYTFNSTTGVITLQGGLALTTGETLFVLYKKKVTT